MDFCSFLVHIGGLITFSFFSLFSHCNCTEISKFSQSLLINVSTVGGIYLDNGFGYSIIDYRGNEEATWQEIDRGDVKRLAIWRISTKRSLRSRHITSRYVTSPPITPFPATLTVIPCRHQLKLYWHWAADSSKCQTQIRAEILICWRNETPMFNSGEYRIQDVFFEYWMIASPWSHSF